MRTPSLLLTATLLAGAAQAQQEPTPPAAPITPTPPAAPTPWVKPAPTPAPTPFVKPEVDRAKIDADRAEREARRRRTQAMTNDEEREIEQAERVVNRLKARRDLSKEETAELATAEKELEHAKSLRMRGASSGQEKKNARRVPTEEESLALAAMEGLMSQPADRALPILKKVLAGSQTTLVKERALFVLAQTNKPEAQAIMLEYAKNPQNELRPEAIRNIGISGNANALAALKDIYYSSDDAVKRSVMQAWQISGRKAEVFDVAMNAQTEAEASRAIRALSVMGAREELRKVGEKRKNSKSLMEAYAISGDLVSLRKIADGDGDVALRAEATRRIGIIGSDGARTALREIYAASAAPELRDAALNGMMISNDQQGVLAAYRAAKTAEEKRSLLRVLSHMGGDAALQAIDAALETRK